MQAGPLSSSSSKKANNRRRRVADVIQEQHPESVRSLLAALEIAQKSSSAESARVAPTELKKSNENEKTKKSHSNKTENKACCSKQSTSGNRPNRSRHNSHQEGSRQRSSNSVSTGSSKTSQKQVQKGPSIPKEVLSDLEFRFITNIPDHEKYDDTRVCFQIELAHWFYVDYYVNKELCGRSDCPNMGMREFARQMFYTCSELSHLSGRVDIVLEKWRHYKSNVPTYGAILLDESLEKVLLVQGFYSSKNSWGFPKGKVNENEEPRKCAIREVYEETGYDFSEKSPGGEHKIQKFINDTMVRLYIVTNVPTDFNFAPITRNEIRRIEWFNVWDLPTDKNDQAHRMGPLSNNNFYTVIPFVQDMQNYIKKERDRRMKNKAQEERKPAPTSLLSLFNFKTNETTPFVQQVPRSHTTVQVPLAPVEAHGEATPLVVTPLIGDSVPSEISSTSHVLSDLFRQPESLISLFPSMKQTTSSSVSGFSQSPFRPVDDVAQSLLNIVKPVSKTTPQIAHPIAIPAKGKPFVDRSMQEVSAPRKQRISISETSAFKAIPQSKSNSSIRSIDFNSSPAAAQPADQSLVECSLPRPSRPPPEQYQQRRHHVVLCDAWKDFHLDIRPFVEMFRAI